MRRKVMSLSQADEWVQEWIVGKMMFSIVEDESIHNGMGNNSSEIGKMRLDACAMGFEQVVNSLIESKADLDAQDVDGYPILIFSVDTVAVTHIC